MFVWHTQAPPPTSTNSYESFLCKLTGNNFTFLQVNKHMVTDWQPSAMQVCSEVNSISSLRPTPRKIVHRFLAWVSLSLSDVERGRDSSRGILLEENCSIFRNSVLNLIRGICPITPAGIHTSRLIGNLTFLFQRLHHASFFKLWWYFLCSCLYI